MDIVTHIPLSQKHWKGVAEGKQISKVPMKQNCHLVPSSNAGFSYLFEY